MLQVGILIFIGKQVLQTGGPGHHEERLAKSCASMQHVLCAESLLLLLHVVVMVSFMQGRGAVWSPVLKLPRPVAKPYPHLPAR